MNEPRRIERSLLVVTDLLELLGEDVIPAMEASALQCYCTVREFEQEVMQYVHGGDTQTPSGEVPWGV
jgi:hypothetical protein